MSIKNLNYGVRTFDLGTAREKERVEINASHISVLQADSDADIHIGSPNAAGIPARRLQAVTLPTNNQRIYLSNPANSGKLVLLNGLEGVEASVPEPDNDVNVTDDSTRELGKVRVQDSGGVLIDPATAALEGALQSAGTDAYLVQENSPLDVSGATVPVEQQSAVGVENSGGTQVDPATETTLSSIDTNVAQEATQNAISNTLANEANLAFGQASVSTAGTAVALNGGTSETIPNGAVLTCRADVATDGDLVYVGDSTVSSSDGFKLADGEGVSLQVTDIATVHIDADTAGDGVSWIVEQE